MTIVARNRPTVNAKPASRTAKPSRPFGAGILPDAAKPEPARKPTPRRGFYDRSSGFFVPADDDLAWLTEDGARREQEEIDAYLDGLFAEREAAALMEAGAFSDADMALVGAVG